MIDILYVGRLHKIKHVETIIRAVSLLKNDFPNINCTILGDGNEKTSLENLIASQELHNNVFLLGYQKDVWFYYQRAKVSVLILAAVASTKTLKGRIPLDSPALKLITSLIL